MQLKVKLAFLDSYSGNHVINKLLRVDLLLCECCMDIPVHISSLALYVLTFSALCFFETHSEMCV